MVMTFLLTGVTVSRVFPMFLLSEGYTTYEIAGVLISRVIGNLLALLNFKMIFNKFGAFRLLTIGIVLITQCLVLIFSFVSFYVYLPMFLMLGFFEQCSSLIIKPILKDFVPNYYKQFEIVLVSFIRFLSGFLIIVNKEYLGFILISLVTITLIPYALSEARNLFKKHYIQTYEASLLFVHSHYSEYLISAFFHHVCEFLMRSYLVVFFNYISLASAATYLSIYMWGQFVFSYPLNVLASSIKNNNRLLLVNLLIIVGAIINICTFSTIIGSLEFYGINVVRALSLAALGGIFSISMKSYFTDIKKKEHDISPDMVDDQIKTIGSLFGVVIGLTIFELKNKMMFFFAIIIINSINIIHVYFSKIFSIIQGSKKY
jgi:hypothetical protein